MLRIAHCATSSPGWPAQYHAASAYRRATRADVLRRPPRRLHWTPTPAAPLMARHARGCGSAIFMRIARCPSGRIRLGLSRMPYMPMIFSTLPDLLVCLCFSCAMMPLIATACNVDACRAYVLALARSCATTGAYRFAGFCRTACHGSYLRPENGTPPSSRRYRAYFPVTARSLRYWRYAMSLARYYHS